MNKIYLTIDDSPSEKTADILSFLEQSDIQALFFVRGDQMDRFPGAVESIIERGHLVGNHTYSHQRASDLSYESLVADIERCEALIDKAYAACGRSKGAKYFRFPHMDRGAGGYVVDYDAYPHFKSMLVPLFADGLNLELKRPDAAAFEKKDKLQDYLAKQGYVQPFDGVSFDWFTQTELNDARDCMFTFSNSDWMLTERHLARDWPYKTLSDLKAKIEDDAFLQGDGAVNIVLMHDQAEIVSVALDLLHHMRDKGFEFIKYNK